LGSAGFTVTLHVACMLLPSFAFTVIVVVPSVLAVTKPVLLTVAILLLLLLQVTDLLFALFGVIVTLNCFVCPSSNITLVGLTVIPVTNCVTLIPCDMLSILFPALSTVNTCK